MEKQGAIQLLPYISPNESVQDLILSLLTWGDVKVLERDVNRYLQDTSQSYYLYFKPTNVDNCGWIS